MVFCCNCGEPNDIDENCPISFLGDEEDNNSIICYHCMHQRFKPTQLAYVIEMWDIGDGLEPATVSCEGREDQIKYVEWYLNPNNGLGHKYLVVIHYNKTGVPIKKQAIKLTISI
jgi:hypothetical protein